MSCLLNENFIEMSTKELLSVNGGCSGSVVGGMKAYCSACTGIISVPGGEIGKPAHEGLNLYGDIKVLPVKGPSYLFPNNGMKF